MTATGGVRDWCVGSYGRPSHLAARTLEGPGDPKPVTVGGCVFCQRVVRVGSSGHLRRHRKALAASVAAMSAPEPVTPPYRARPTEPPPYPPMPPKRTR